MRQPSKYAARLAQAFTATEPSVKIRRDEWEEMEDLSPPPPPGRRVSPYLFTDGVGTISVQLGDMIWGKLCEQMPEGRQKRSIKPSAVNPSFTPHDSVLRVTCQYQIRFLGRISFFLDLRQLMFLHRLQGDGWNR